MILVSGYNDQACIFCRYHHMVGGSWDIIIYRLVDKRSKEWKYFLKIIFLDSKNESSLLIFFDCE